MIASLLCVVLSLRAVSRRSPRPLLGAHSIEQPAGVDPRRSRGAARTLGARSRWRLALDGGRDSSEPAAQAGAFFGAGAALLTAFLFLLSSWLRSRDATADRRARGLGDVPARVPRRGISAGAERAVGGPGGIGGVHHRVGRRVPPRRGRARPGPGVGHRRIRAAGAVRAAARARPRHRGGPGGAGRAVVGIRARPASRAFGRGRATT